MCSHIGIAYKECRNGRGCKFLFKIVDLFWQNPVEKCGLIQDSILSVFGRMKEGVA